MYIRLFWQGNHNTHGHIRCVYTVLANPIYLVRRNTCQQMLHYMLTLHARQMVAETYIQWFRIAYSDQPCQQMLLYMLTLHARQMVAEIYIQWFKIAYRGPKFHTVARIQSYIQRPKLHTVAHIQSCVQRPTSKVTYSGQHPKLHTEAQVTYSGPHLKLHTEA